MGQSVPKRRHIKFRRRGIPKNKKYSICNTTKVGNPEHLRSFSPSRRARVNYDGIGVPLSLYVHRVGADMSEGDDLARPKCKQCVQRRLVCVAFGLTLHTSWRQAQFGDYIRFGWPLLQGYAAVCGRKAICRREKEKSLGTRLNCKRRFNQHYLQLHTFYLPMCTVIKKKLTCLLSIIRAMGMLMVMSWSAHGHEKHSLLLFRCVCPQQRTLSRQRTTNDRKLSSRDYPNWHKRKSVTTKYLFQVFWTRLTQRRRAQVQQGHSLLILDPNYLTVGLPWAMH